MSAKSKQPSDSSKKANEPAAAPAKPMTQLELMMAARAKKKAEVKGAAAPSAKSLGAPRGGSPGGHGDTHAKSSGGAAMPRRTAPGG